MDFPNSWSLTKDHVTQVLNLKSFASQDLWNTSYAPPSIILVMDTLKEPYRTSKIFCTKVNQRDLTLTYNYHSIELLPGSWERNVLQNYLDAHTEICYLQMQEKHNVTLDPKSQTTIQMQLNEGQYVVFVSNPYASHGFTLTHGTVKKSLNNSRSALIQLTIFGKFILRNRRLVVWTQCNLKNTKSKAHLLC